MAHLKHLGISGGGTKIAGLFGAAETIIFDKNYRPEIISGISAGAILAVPLAMSMHHPDIRQKIKEKVLNLQQGDFFNRPPVNEDGSIRKINALVKVIFGAQSLGEQENLKKTISEIIGRQEFGRYVNDSKYPVCIVGTVDFYTGKRFYFNLKKVGYEHFLEFVNASGSIPIFTPGYATSDQLFDFENETSRYPHHLLFDGGVRDHSPTAKILESAEYRNKIKENVTIFSRPAKADEILNPDDFQGNKDIVKILARYVDITNAEVSKNDEEREAELANILKLAFHRTIYLPRVLRDVYDINPQKLRELYNAGKLAVEQYWNPIA